MGPFGCKWQKIRPKCHKPKEMCYLIQLQSQKDPWLQALLNWSSGLSLTPSLSSALLACHVCSWAQVWQYDGCYQFRPICSQVEVQNKRRKDIVSTSRKHHIAFHWFWRGHLPMQNQWQWLKGIQCSDWPCQSHIPVVGVILPEAPDLRTGWATFPFC